MASRTIEEHEAELTELRGRVQEIDTEYAGEALPDEIRTEWDDKNLEIEAKVGLIDELRARQDRVKAISADPGSREAGADFHVRSARVAENIWDTASVRAQSRSGRRGVSDAQRQRQARGRAVPLPEREREPRGLPGAHRAAPEQVRQDADRQHFARHLLTDRQPAVPQGVRKAITGQTLSMEEQRSLSLTSGSGGYAVPVTLDPTIIPTSNGAVNPWRAISRTVQITGNTWNGVTAGAVVASRDAEFEEVSDDAPTLVQPTATVTKAHAFIPFSIEVGQDWGSIESEMAQLISGRQGR
jgi:HK97 family phage major capsid protein